MTAKSALRGLIIFCLVGAPMGLLVGWILNYTSVADYFKFQFANPYVSRGQSSSALEFATVLKGADGGFRSFLLPHFVIFFSMPCFLGLAGFFGFRLYSRAPWLALAGGALTSLGAMYFVAVLGAWFAFGRMGDLAATPEALAPILAKTTEVSGILMVSTMLSLFIFVGLIIFAVALWRTRLAPRWSAVMMGLGNALICAFGGTENWMSIGALMILAAMVPFVLGGFRDRATIRSQA